MTCDSDSTSAIAAHLGVYSHAGVKALSRWANISEAECLRVLHELGAIDIGGGIYESPLCKPTTLFTRGVRGSI